MKIVLSLALVVLLSVGNTTLAQTIVVDPDTYEIRVINDESEPSIQENEEPQEENQEVEEENQVIEEKSPIQEVQEQATQTTSSTTTVEENTGVRKSESINEFEDALAWMYQNEMTIFDNAEQYEPFNQLTRAQFAKMVNRFSILVNHDRNVVSDKCDFIDNDQADPTLLNHIITTCKIGIFKGYQDYSFQPNKVINKAEALAVLLRIYNGARSDESTDPRWAAYHQQAFDLGITAEENAANLEQVINRYLIALYMHRLYIIMDGEKESQAEPEIETVEPETVISSKTVPAIVEIQKEGDTITQITIESETQSITVLYNKEDNTYSVQQ